MCWNQIRSDLFQSTRFGSLDFFNLSIEYILIFLSFFCHIKAKPFFTSVMELLLLKYLKLFANFKSRATGRWNLRAQSSHYAKCCHVLTHFSASCGCMISLFLKCTFRIFELFKNLSRRVDPNTRVEEARASGPKGSFMAFTDIAKIP